MTILVGGDAAFESSKTRRVKTGQQVRTRNTPFILLLLYTHILVIPKLSTREAQLRRFFELRRIEEEIYAGVNEQMNAIDRALGLAPCYIDDEERELIEELDKEAKLLDLEAEMMDAMEFGPENTLSAQLQRMDFEFIQRLMCPQVPSKKKKGVSAPTATRHPVSDTISLFIKGFNASFWLLERTRASCSQERQRASITLEEEDIARTKRRSGCCEQQGTLYYDP